MILSNTDRDSLCLYHTCWSRRKSSVVRSDSAPVCLSASVSGAKEPSPRAFSNRLRICRLMYKPLPHGSCKSDLRQHRNRRLALVKKRAIRLVQTFAARRAIPHYFQKRVKQTLLAKTSASTHNSAVDNAPSANGSADVTFGEVTENSKPITTESEELGNIQVKEEDPSTIPQEHIVPSATEDSKILTVSASRTTIIDRTDTLSTIKEYYSIQSAIRLLLTMLQERMEEVESLQKKSIMAAPKEEFPKEANDSLPTDNGAESNGPLTEDDPTVNESLLKTDVNGTTDRPVETADPNKENNVPIDSTLETVAVALTRVISTPSKDEPREDARSYSFLETSKSDILDPTYTCDIELEPLERRKNRSIVDSLLNKFNLSPPAKATPPSSFSDNSLDGMEGRRSLRDRTKIAARPRYIEIPEEPRKMRVSKVFGKLHKTLNLDLDCTNSNSSTEFYGFDEGEIVKLDKPSVPGLLPTPIVKKSQPFAPFLAYGSSMDADKVETGAETRSDLFREEGLISFGSLPPRLECPQRPTDMVRPRTVAQKRILVQRENDVRYLMIDNESKIFQFLKKRSKNIDAALDFCRMKELQDQKIPFTRDTWRALAWLRTEKGRYYFQTMNIDNRTIKLTGCQGNHRFKTLVRNPLYSSPVVASRGHRYHYVSNCHCPPFPEGVTLNISPDADGMRNNNNLSRSDTEQQMVGDNSRYLYRGSSNDTGHQNKRSYPGTKPGPLSSKCLQPSPDDDPTLGRLEIFKMPPVELEVFPKLNRPLDGYVKPFLKMILPHDGITENWARFAVSTLTADGTYEDKKVKGLNEKEEHSFVFELPYLNNQRRMLIRRRFLACPGSPVQCDVEQFEKLMDEKLTFRAAIDQALAEGKGDEIDPDELVCADILSAITDSVAIGLAEDIFVKDDPDVEYVKREGKARPFREQITMPIKIETPLPGAGDVKTSTPSPAARNDVGLGADATIPSANGSVTSEGSNNKTVDPVKSKLLREMKRLNATIIEGPIEPPVGASETSRQQQQQRCDPQYCSMGCICDVRYSSQPATTAAMHRRQHCRQSGCILGCKCGFEEKHVNQTQEVKMDHTQDEEGEATALSSADVKYLREKATARLAKEEREFTHTVILTKNTTVLVHNKETESRRQKKKPKKYDDYYNDLSMQSLLNGGSVKDVTQYISKPPPNAKPLSAADRMRHAHVVLNKLPQLADIEPLCMVHDLYRCFCDGKATQGKPFTFTEDSCPSPAKTFVSDVPHSVDNGTLVVMSANGRMMGAKNRDKEPEIVQPSYDIASIANVRKRLYSFEKAHHEPLVDRSSSCSSDGKSSKGHHGTVQRKRRDSSEESYKPPNERKVAKKKPHTSFEEKSAAVSASAASIRARRASVAPSHVYNRSLAARRPSVAITAPAALPPPKSDLLGIRRASVAHPLLPKEANVFKSPGKATAGDAQYTVVKPKRASGGINNIIIKRIPTPNANFEPMVNKATPLSKPLAKKSTPPSKTKVQGSVDLSVPPVKYMSVRKLKQLMISEYKNSPDVKQTPDNASCSEAKLAFVNILLLDSEENIDNEPQLNILSDGTKKLVINGNRRSFIESKAFKDGIPPERTMPYRNRTTYVVQILTASSAPEEEAMESKAPAAKAKSNEKVIQKRIAPLESSTSSSSGDPSCIEPDILMQSAAFAEKQSRSVQSQQQSVNNPTEQTDRQLCSLMRHINELLRRETLHINPAKKGIMHICRWNQMLNAFALGEIDVLDLTLTNGLEMTVIATAPFKQQLVPNVQHQISARRLTIDKMIAAERPSLLMKMVVCNVESVKTNELALVMYGNDNFWHFCGFLKVNEKYFKTDSNIPRIPSTFTNTKIRARLNEYHRKTFPSATNKMNTANTAKQTPSNKQQHSSSSSSSEPAPSTNMLSTQSNIEIMPKAIQPVHFPLGLLPGIGDSTDEVSACRWMRLKIENDFSHMYLPTWQCCVTYGRIKKAIYDANRLSKPIRLDNPAPTNQLHMQQRPYMYALPKEGHALFLGPYKSAEKKIDVILCQSVQGSLYEREVYEKQNGIPTTTNTKRTVGWWVDAATSRVATVKEKIRPTAIHKADRLAEAVKKLSGNTVQRSLLKRNNIPSATAVSTDQQIENDSKPIDNEVVIVESDDNDDDDGNNSKTNEQAPTRKDLSVDQIGMDLFRLVEGTMKQNQQEKREIEKVLEQERVTKSVILSDDHNRNEPNRKRQSSPVPHVSAAKVVRRSDTDIERVPALQQQQQKPVASSSVRVPPNTTIARNNFTRLSLHSPQSLKTGTNAVTRTNNGVSTLKITQLKPTEGVRHASRPLNALLGATGRALSLSKTAFTNEPGQPGGIAGAPKPRPRLNSIAVERVVSRPAPVVHDSDDEDDVVWVDDENDGNVTAKVPLASGSVERTEAAAVGSSINNGVTAYGQKTILSQEQIAMIARRVDLTKTGQQDGYSFNPASGLLKMKRSLLNSIKNDVMLGEASTLSSSVKSAVPPSLNGKVGVLINTAKPTLPSVSSTSVSGKAGVESSSTFTNNAKSTTPSASTSLNTSTTPSSTITMPRTKVVPRVTVTAATARYGDVPGRRISDGGVGNSVIPPGSAGTASGLLDNLKYLSEAQEEKLLAEQPYTRGVLESKIPGLGLVEVVRFEREVIIHMKELTVKKQLVSVQNLEAAVTLLNQFIQRNTYAFRPYNLAIQWKFKERSLSLRPEEKMTSVISQFCIVTVYGIINLSKPEQVKSVEFTLPALYEDLMKMKLAMQCYSKQHYEDEQCYENDDKIYDRAVGIITSVNAKSKWLTQQRETLMKQRRVNREKLRQLKEASSPAEGKNPPAKDTPVKDVSGGKGSQESVIVIDDD